MWVHPPLLGHNSYSFYDPSGSRVAGLVLNLNSPFLQEDTRIVIVVRLLVLCLSKSIFANCKCYMLLGCESVLLEMLKSKVNSVLHILFPDITVLDRKILT